MGVIRLASLVARFKTGKWTTSRWPNSRGNRLQSGGGGIETLFFRPEPFMEYGASIYIRYIEIVFRTKPWLGRERDKHSLGRLCIKESSLLKQKATYFTQIGNPQTYSEQIGSGPLYMLFFCHNAFFICMSHIRLDKPLPYSISFCLIGWVVRTNCPIN